MVDRSTAGLSDLHPRLSFFSTVLLLLFSHFSVSFLASFSLSLSLSSLSLFLPLPPSRSLSPSSLRLSFPPSDWFTHHPFLRYRPPLNRAPTEIDRRLI